MSNISVQSYLNVVCLHLDDGGIDRCVLGFGDGVLGLVEDGRSVVPTHQYRGLGPGSPRRQAMIASLDVNL